MLSPFSWVYPSPYYATVFQGSDFSVQLHSLETTPLVQSYQYPEPNNAYNHNDFKAKVRLAGGEGQPQLQQTGWQGGRTAAAYTAWVQAVCSAQLAALLQQLVGQVRCVSDHGHDL